MLASFGLPGIPRESGHALLPCINVMPMGFGWALHFCQAVMRNSIHQAGFLPSQVIQMVSLGLSSGLLMIQLPLAMLTTI